MWNKLALCKGMNCSISDSETINWITCNRMICFKTLLAEGKLSPNVLSLFMKNSTTKLTQSNKSDRAVIKGCNL